MIHVMHTIHMIHMMHMIHFKNFHLTVGQAKSSAGIKGELKRGFGRPRGGCGVRRRRRRRRG